MPSQDVKRKLAAILSADVKGYSRLMREDEEGTLRTLNEYKELMFGFIRQFRGRVVGTAGDSVLAEYSSVVDAVRCAIEIQKELRVRNSDLPDDRKMEFRIGINLGDVIEEGDTIYGDGVNIAARIQSLAEGGGISISGTVYEQVEKRLRLRYEYSGEQSVKNIDKPIRIYRVLDDIQEPSEGQEKVGGKKRKFLVAAVVVVLVVATSVALWQFVWRSPSSKNEVASREKMALPLPDTPSIAVLPFVNISEDPKQDFLGDGITGNIITALSKMQRLLVIDRNSTFTYKGKLVKVKQVSEELGVQYVLEGSVQRAANRVRISAQLIDALTGHHIWAEKYDRDLNDVFALQDEITINILRAVQVKVTSGELSPQGKHYKGKQGLDCYLKYMEGLYYQSHQTIEGTIMARRLAEEAIALCPQAPGPYSLLGWVNLNDYWLGSSKSPRESLDKAIGLMQKAISLDDSIAESHGSLSRFYAINREYEKAVAEGERAVTLNPGGALVLAYFGGSLIAAGRPGEAIPLLQKAIRLNPLGPAYYFQVLGDALRWAGQLEEAVPVLKKAIQRQPNLIWPHVHLAATYSLMGREKDSRDEAEEILRINPKFSLDYLAKVLSYKDQSGNEKYINALRKAGLK